MSTNPHDALFKFTFSDIEHVVGELRTILPAGLVRQIDFGSLERVPETFVDEWLIGRRSDVLFSAQIGGRRAFLYLLVEHQSTVDPLMPSAFCGTWSASGSNGS